MRLLKREWSKLWLRPSFLGLAAALLLLNGILLYTKTPQPDFSASVWKNMYQELAVLPEKERREEIGEQYEKMKTLILGKETPVGRIKLSEHFFTKEEYERMQILQEFERQAARQESYDSWLSDIQKKAKEQESISIFQSEDPFSDRNARKTAEDFKDHDRITPVFINSRGFLAGTDFAGTDVLALGLLFYMALHLFVREREQGLTALLFPTKNGRMSLAGAKIGALFLGCVFTNLVFWGMNLFLSCLQYGAPDWWAPIQSVSGYLSCVLKVTVGEYLLLFLVSKIWVYFLLVLIFSSFCLRFRKGSFACSGMGLLFAVSYGLYQAVDGNSVFQLIKYVNLIPFVQVNPVYQTYFNVNLFSYPVNRISLSLLSWAALTVFFAAADLYGFSQQKAVTSFSAAGSRKKFPKMRYGGLLGQELYKCLVMHKGLAILTVFILAQGGLFFQKESHPGADEIYYQKYMQQLQGSVTDEEMKMLQEENRRLKSYERMLEEGQKEYEEGEMPEEEWNALLQLVQDNTKSRAAFEQVIGRFAYLKELAGTKKENPGFVYERGYETLAGLSEEGYREDFKQGIWLMSCSILICSGIFAGEFSAGMVRILNCTLRGRQETVKKKLQVTAGLSIILFLISYLPGFVKTLQVWGLPCPGASCAAIPSLADFSMKLWQYLALLYGLRYLFYCSILFMVEAVSVWLRGTVKTMAFCFLLFVFPQTLHLLGITLTDCFSLNVYLSGNLFLHNAKGPLFLMAALPVVLAGLSWRFIQKSCLQGREKSCNFK